MQKSSSLFNRPDTLFGVCQGIGQEFGFNANYLRIALAVSLLWNPIAVIGTYVALGVAVALAHLLFPVRTAPATTAHRVDTAPAHVDDEAEAVALAA
ncbi:MAG: PspC domain-containing protein [Sphingomonas sp.]